MKTNRLHPGYGHPVLRDWQGEQATDAARLVYPLFVASRPRAKEAIGSLPGQYRWGVRRLREALKPAVKDGLRAVLLFGVPGGAKDARGTGAEGEGAPVPRAIAELRAAFPELLVMADVCLCAYTDHGHCAVLRRDGTPDLPASLERLSGIAAAYALAGRRWSRPPT
jgi:porphobilinogen synthase